jgi:hypothetical protein
MADIAALVSEAAGKGDDESPKSDRFASAKDDATDAAFEAFEKKDKAAFRRALKDILELDDD